MICWSEGSLLENGTEDTEQSDHNQTNLEKPGKLRKNRRIEENVSEIGEMEAF